MNTRGSAIKVLVFVVSMTVLGTAIGMVLDNFHVYPTNDYHAEFTDVTGLTPGSDVRAAGVTVGRVESVARTPDGTADVAFSARNVVRLDGGTTATIKYKNLTGDRYLSLAPGDGPANPLPPGARIPLARTRPALDLDQLYGGFQPLFQALSPQQVNQLSSSLISVLQGEGATVHRLLADVASLTTTLADRDKIIGEVVRNLGTVLGGLDSHGRQFDNVLNQLQRVASGLAGDHDVIGESLADIDSMAGTTAQLLQKVRPEVRGTVRQLGRLSAILNTPSARSELDYVLQQYPKAYQQMQGAGSFGSFFNFYLCALRLKLTGPDGKPITTPYLAKSDEKRCQFE